MQYTEILKDIDMTQEELESLAIEIAEAEEKGDMREAEILKTKIPFSENFFRCLKPMLGEEAYDKSLAELKIFRCLKNKTVLEKYTTV